MEKSMPVRSRLLVTVLSLLLVSAGLLHHYAVSGKIFDVEDVLHHEPLYLLIIGFAAGAWLIPTETRPKRKNVRENSKLSREK